MSEDEVRQTIIGAAFRVHQYFGAGFIEKVYENALRCELEQAGLRVRQQYPIDVYYHERKVGEFFADLYVEDCVLVELKAVARTLVEHEVQLVNYLTATDTDCGLLLNFGGKSVEVKRRFKRVTNRTQKEE